MAQRFSLSTAATGLALLVAASASACTSPASRAAAIFSASSGVSAAASPVQFTVAALSGHVIVPQATIGAANIVAQGGGNIVAAGGGNIVAQGGGNIVAQGGGNIVAQGGGNFALLTDAAATSAALPAGDVVVSGAIVTLRDVVTRGRLKWAPPLQTDTAGNFTYPAIPAGVNFIIEVDFITQGDHTAYRELSIGKAVNGQVVPVSWCCTAMMGLIMDETTTSSTGSYLFDASPVLPKVITDLKAAYGSTQGIAAAAKQAISANAADVTTNAGAVTLSVPDVLAADEESSARDIATGGEAKNADFGSVVSTVGAGVVAPTTAELQARASAASALASLTTLPAVQNGTITLTAAPAAATP